MSDKDKVELKRIQLTINNNIFVIHNKYICIFVTNKFVNYMKEFFINLINEERTKQKLSKSELAKRAGITLNQFRNIEAGRNTTIDSLDRILKALEVKRVNIKLV